MSEDDEVAAGLGVAVEDNSLGRLLALSDGIFAIAMTLFALDLRVPDLSHPTDAALRHALADNSASYLTFVLSFYVTSTYWIRHRRLMRSVVKAHSALTRDTLFLLIMVAAMPFFAGLLGRYGSQPTALALYGAANVLAVSTLIALRRDISRLGLDQPNGPRVAADEAAQRLQTWAHLGIFVLCIPAGYVLGRHGPFVLLLLAIPSRVSLLRGGYARVGAWVSARGRGHRPD